MSRWFRLYDDTLNHPKILKLSDKMHRVWIGLLCVASKNDGRLPELDDCALMLRMKPSKLEAAIKNLINSNLIDSDGVMLWPHNWSKRQFKSDTSNDRVQRHRERKRNVTCNVTVTPPDTDTDTERKNQKKEAAANAARQFKIFWEVYPKRQGSNPVAPAEKKFSAMVTRGVSAELIIAGARSYAQQVNRDRTEPKFVAMASTWLNQERWRDYTNGKAMSPEEARQQAVADELRKYGIT